MQRKSTARSAGFIILACLVWACGAPSSSTDQQTDSLAQVDVNRLEEVTRTPIAEEVPLFKLREVQSEFDETLLNTTDRIDDYLVSEDKAAMNLGVYATDALYLAIYDKTSEYILSSNICQRIGSDLGIRDGFSAEMGRRLDANAGNSDSVCTILNESVRRAKHTLEEDGQERIAAMIATGSFVENLHLLCTSVKNHPAAQPGQDKRFAVLVPTVKDILKQKETLRNIRERLARLGKDETVNWLSENLGPLETELNKVEITPAQPNDGLTATSIDKIVPWVAKVREYVVR